MALVAVAVCALLHMAAIAPGRRESELDHGPVFLPPQRGDENGQQVMCSEHARFTVSATEPGNHSVHAVSASCILHGHGAELAPMLTTEFHTTLLRKN
jgi:hypothetical protein